MQRSYNMGESSGCIVRSFSQPISYEYKEEEHYLRALTSSVSFGRFVSDSLDWEKFSCFTQNRCLEEVQRLSKPGSVAAMKAHFEARYKRVAAKKAAATFAEQENEVANNSPALSVVNEIHNNSLVDSDVVKSNKDASFHATQEKEAHRNVTIFSSDANSNVSVERNDMETTPTPMKGAEVTREQLVSNENSTDVDSSSQLGNAQNHSNIIFAPDKKIPSKGTTDMGDLTSSSKRKPEVSSSKSSIFGGVSKLRAPVKPTIIISPTKEDNATPNCKKISRDSMEKKGSRPESLKKSMNFVSHAGISRKTSSPVLDRLRNSRIVKSFVKLSKDNPTRQAPTGASMHGVAKHSNKTPSQENLSCLESSSASGRKSRTTSVFSSFNFRSEERAAKRKEKLENNLNTKESQKVQLQEKSKIPPTCPCPPKLGRKPPPSRIQDATSSRPPWRFSGKTDSSKLMAEKNKQIPTRSFSSLPKKNMRENASPNIMH